jgi:putative CocE/NonD family hydrolase
VARDPIGPRPSEERYRVVVERDVRIPMRDGTRLALDVYLPDAPGTFPTLLERTPYDKRASMEVIVDAPAFFASRGYAVAIQDVRGCFASEGELDFLVDDGWGKRQDGYDTVEAIARFSWCNGRIGTIGGSTTGGTQYFMAPTRPPHLAGQFVREGTWRMYDDTFTHGALELDVMVHVTLTAARQRLVELGPDSRYEPLLAAIDADFARRDETCRRRPLMPLLPPDVPEATPDWLAEMLRHPIKDHYWDTREVAGQAHQIDVPILHLGAWFDSSVDGTISAFGAIRENGGPRARSSQRLVVGPWIHGPQHIDKRRVGELDFGAEAAADYNAMRLPWFDRWLKDVPPVDDPIARFFTMGTNRWQDADSWPPRDTTTSVLFLAPGPSDSTRSLNDGRLAPSSPGESGRDGYRHDPDDPIPTLGGNRMAEPNGPRDHRAVEPRLLTYTSPVLAADLEVTGQPIVELYASSSAVDTDFVVRLCDVYPDGRAMLVDEGILRARFRHSFAQPELLTPGRVERYRIPLSPTSNVFRAGHRLRLHVTSSSFPRWHPNTGTAETSWYAAVALPADNAVHRGPEHPSALQLPIRTPLHFAGDRVGLQAPP